MFYLNKKYSLYKMWRKWKIFIGYLLLSGPTILLNLTLYFDKVWHIFSPEPPMTFCFRSLKYFALVDESNGEINKQEKQKVFAVKFNIILKLTHSY